MTIHLVFITHNRLEYTRPALQSVLADPTEEFALTIWDNASTDGTVEFLRKEVSDPRIADLVLRRENVGQTAAVNETWARSQADLLGKLDNDCIMTPGWTRTLAQAHADIPELGVVACWHFFAEDFDYARARRKIQTFGRHQIFRHPWTCGTGLLIKRTDFEEFGPIREKATTQYWLHMARAGRVNGFYYPLIYQEHMDDPQSRYCRIRNAEDFEKYKAITFGLNTGRYDDVEGRLRVRDEMVRNLLEDPFDPRCYVGWRRRVRQFRACVDALRSRGGGAVMEPYAREVPLVSVLIPVYNAGEYLRPALESIRHQTYGNLEILVIDDGSTDGCLQTIADLRDPRVQVLQQPNAGKAAALNRGLAAIRGEFYAIQDADDLSYPTRIERQVDGMVRHPEAAAVFTGCDLLVGNRRLAPRCRAKGMAECRQDIEGMRMPSHDPTPMFRVSLVKGFLYEPQLRIGQAWDYILRVGERHPMVVLGECLYSYRINPASNTRQDTARREEKIREVLHRACERRGLTGERVASRRARGAGWAVHRETEYGLVPHFMESVLDARRRGDWLGALRTAAACARMHVWDPYYYKPLAYFVLPLGMIELYRQKKRRARNRPAYG